MKVVAAVLAAGRGTRFGADKTVHPLRGKPIWRYSYEAFLNHPEVGGVGIVCRSDALEKFQVEAPEAYFVVEGGASRQDSAAAALSQVADDDILLIHDGARPFVSGRLISDVIEAVWRSGAAAPGLDVTDTIRSRGDLATLDRDGLLAMQTPQGAKAGILKRALEQANREYTDEVALLRNAGILAEMVVGERRNFKITTQEDLAQAASILGNPENRTGIGYDVHPFSSDDSRRLFLGGVHFEATPGLAGHSDADVLLHAVVDALLGAAGLGDIGQIFPDTDPSWKDKSSIYFLCETKAMLRERGWRILNIDATVIAEYPKVMKKAEAIRDCISKALDIEPRRVSVKATTNERLGSIGRGEGIAAFAVATLCESV